MALGGLAAKLPELLPPFLDYINKKSLLPRPLPQLVPFTTFLAKFNLIFFFQPQFHSPFNYKRSL